MRRAIELIGEATYEAALFLVIMCIVGFAVLVYASL